MAVNFSALVYLPNFDQWARPITVTPIKSWPGQPAYTNRGIFSTRPVAIQTDVGVTLVSDQETILDIRDVEFSVLPEQGDLINIPMDEGIPAEGDFEVTETNRNGGGETTLVLRKYEPPASTPW